MASVNRESLRRSFDEQKRTFERLKRDGAMTPESIALIDALMTLLELPIAVFMEKTTTKTGRNSGLPSSRAPQDETARGAPGARGRGPKENAAAAANTRVVTGREESVVEQCWSCGADLAGAACAGHERRTLIDIVFETVEHHVRPDQALPALPRRDPGTLPREHARAAAIRSRHPRLGGPPPPRRWSAVGLTGRAWRDNLGESRASIRMRFLAAAARG